MEYMMAAASVLLLGMLFRILLLLERLERCAQILRRRRHEIPAEERGADGQESEGERQAREAIEKFNLGVTGILSYDAGKE